MRQKMAVFSMIARHSWSRVMVLLAVLVGGNAVVFWMTVKDGFSGLADALDCVASQMVFLAVFLLIYINKESAMCDRGGKQNYFLNRLRISHKAVYMTQWLYNSLCFTLLFAVEGLSLLGLCFLAGLLFPDTFNHQSIMLACYQSALLHTFFPLGDILGWVTNGILALALGACTAALPFRNRGGKNSVSSSLMLGFCVLYFWTMCEGNAIYLDYKLIALFTSAILMTICACSVLWMEVGEDG